jgi:hypothetical protein
MGCAFAGTGDPPPAHWRSSEIQDRKIAESSGLVRSRTHEGVFWTHNDSGDAPRFFAINAAGTLLAEFLVADAANVDWEDIAIDDTGHLYLGDFGNNDNVREDLVVYRVSEPDPAGGNAKVKIERRIPFSYADQERLGDRLRMNFDSEALFWREGALYLFTKHRSDAATQLYRLDPEIVEPQQLTPLARFELSLGADGFLGNTTAADLSPDGRRLALLTYRGIFLFDWKVDDELPRGPIAQLPLDIGVTQQAEAIAWDGAGLIVGNEQRRLFRIPDPFPSAP